MFVLPPQKYRKILNEMFVYFFSVLVGLYYNFYICGHTKLSNDDKKNYFLNTF